MNTPWLIALLFQEPAPCEATPLELPAEAATSTAGAPAGVASPCGVADVYARWFRFVAPRAGRYSIASSGAIDTTLALYADCGVTSLACSDDVQYALDARVDIELGEAQEVFVRVAGWGGVTGDVTLRVDAFPAFERPLNDACEDALVVTQAERAAAHTFAATGVDQSSCGPEDSVDVWYRFVAPSAGEYTFDLTQQLVAAHYVSVHEGCAADARELGCGFFGTRATLEAGQEVWLRVGTNPIVADAINLVVGPEPTAEVPPNDRHSGAIAVEVPSSTSTSTRGATKEGMHWGPSCGPYINPEVWFSFVAPSADVYVFDTNGSALTDTVLAVFGPCDANGEVVPQLLACDDDFGQQRYSRIDGFLEAGQEVCIAVAGHHLSEVGGIVLNVTRLGAPPPNDVCPGAVPVGAGETRFATSFASRQQPVVGACPWGDFPVWFSFTAPADGLYKFDTKASAESSPDIAVVADCGSAVVLACSVDIQPAVSLDMVRGQRVFVRLSTDVWWRSRVALRVTPERASPEPGEPLPEVAPEAIAEVVEPEVTEVGEVSDAAEQEGSPEAIEAVGEPASEDTPEVDRHAATEGCGCTGGLVDPLAVLASWWLSSASRASASRRRARR